MKFRFYIIDLYDGSIRGTDSEAQVKAYTKSEDYFVVDTLHGLWWQPGGTADEVTETKRLELEPEPELEDKED